MPIDIQSRHDDADEWRELQACSAHLAVARLSDIVESLYYDSQSNTCRVSFVPSVAPSDAVVRAVIDVAMHHLSQFEVFDSLHHGGPENEADQADQALPHQEGLSNEQKGLIGEAALLAWFQRERLGFVAICQAQESFASMFRGSVKRPDFLMLIGGIGLLAVDAKNHRCRNERFTLGLENELRRAIAFERLFRLPLWYAYRDCERDDPAWYWISALKVVSVGEIRGTAPKQYLSIDIKHFERIATANDLSKLYSQRVLDVGAVGSLPMD